MRKILIIAHSEELTRILQLMLCCKFDVQVCCDGLAAAELIRETKPQALIIDLLLPHKDGLTVLEEASEYLPDVILALTPNQSNYTLYRAAELGVGYMMQDSCEAKQIVSRLMDMIACAQETAPQFTEPESNATRQLLQLGFTADSDGFRQLQMSIPLYAQDAGQRVCKEIYPSIARLGGYNTGLQVEHSIRNCIKKTWENGDRAVWAEYFPGNTDKCPSNKKFISRLAANL